MGCCLNVYVTEDAAGFLAASKHDSGVSEVSVEMPRLSTLLADQPSPRPHFSSGSGSSSRYVNIDDSGG